MTAVPGWVGCLLGARSYRMGLSRSVVPARTKSSRYLHLVQIEHLSSVCRLKSGHQAVSPSP